MVRIAAYAMFVVACISAVYATSSISTMSMLLDAGVVRPGAKLEVIVLILCGVVIPAGIGVLLLKK